MAEKTSVSGRVSRETLDAGSKHEHEGVVLKTAEGRRFVLRRRDGPSFADPDLATLVGNSITTEGVALGNLFIMKAWHTID